MKANVYRWVRGAVLPLGLALAVSIANLASAQDGKSNPLLLEMVRGSRVLRGRQATVTVRLRNVTDRKIAVYLRRDLLTFEVQKPGGETTVCEPRKSERHPNRRSFTHIGAQRAVVLTARLIELCPRWTFAQSGEYRVTARGNMDRKGESFDFDAFVGELRAEEPVAVEVIRNSRVVTNRFIPNAEQPSPAKKTPPARKARPRRPPAPKGK